MYSGCLRFECHSVGRCSYMVSVILYNPIVLQTRKANQILNMIKLGALILCFLVLGVVHGQKKEDVECWRGEQCDSCGSIASQNGQTVCCQGCYATGFKLKEDICSCFMVRPGSASSATKSTEKILLITLSVLCSFKTFAR